MIMRHVICAVIFLIVVLSLSVRAFAVWRSNIKKALLFLALAVYGAACVYALFCLKLDASTGYSYTEYLNYMHNLIPFKSFYVFFFLAYKSSRMIHLFLMNLVGPILLYLPWGFLAPLCWERLQKRREFLRTTIIGITVIECIQLFATLGIFDIEDILLGTLGAFLGYCIQKGLMQGIYSFRVARNKRQIEK